MTSNQYLYESLLNQHRQIGNQISDIKAQNFDLNQQQLHEVKNLRNKQLQIFRQIQNLLSGRQLDTFQETDKEINLSSQNFTIPDKSTVKSKKQKLLEDFDWELYLLNNEDLRKNGINNKEKAVRHYLRHGIYERKSYEKKILIEKKSDEKDFIEICKNLTRFLPNNFPKIDKNSNKKTLLVETRNLNHLEFLIKNTIQKVGDGWGHIIYCHKNNYQTIKNICNEISSEIELRILKDELNRNLYNNLLLDIKFWEEINCEKVLIYQSDTFICKNFDNNFFKYDYIGGYWGEEHRKKIEDVFNKKEIYVGNGGLSFRTVSLTKKVLIEDKNLKNNILDRTLELIPEDTFFSYKFKDNNFKVATPQIANNFSSAAFVLHPGDFVSISFGLHQPWIYFKTKSELKKNIEKLFFVKTKKRILFINHEESRTGAPLLLKDIIEYELNKEEFEIFTLSLRVGDDNWEIKNKFVLSEFDGKNNKEKVENITFTLSPDLIFANTIVSSEFASYFHCKKILFIHEYRSLKPYINENFSEKLNKFDKILTACEPTKKVLDDNNIENHIMSYYINKKIKKIEKNRQEFIIGSGYAQLRKGLHRFIEIAKELPQEKFLWIGSTKGIDFIDNKVIIEGPSYLLSDELENNSSKLVKYELELPKNLEFTGLVSPEEYVNDFLPKSKCLLMVSTDDPFPLVVIESKILNLNVVTLKESGDSYKTCDKNDLILDKYDKEKIVNYLKKLKPNKPNFNIDLVEKLKKNILVLRKNYVDILNEKIKVFLPIESESSSFSYELLEKTVKSFQRFNFDVKIVTNKITDKLLQVKGNSEIIEYDFEIANYVRDFYPSGDERCFNGEKTSSISGSYFRLDICKICVEKNYKDKFVLYCDSDVICNKDFTHLLNWDVKYFSAAPEWEKQNLSYFNAGLMWMNVKNMHQKYDEIKEYIFKNLPKLHTHDQQALNDLFKSKKINNDVYFDNMDPRMNWRPYWGLTDDFYVLHFHWLKPNTNLEDEKVIGHINIMKEKIDLESFDFYSQFWYKY